jgi:hypothetical protein
MQNLGKKGKDKVTGFHGTIVAKVSYLTGCDQYGITPPVGEDGKLGDTNYFDVGRVEIIGDGVTAESVQTEVKGGPNRDAPRG